MVRRGECSDVPLATNAAQKEDCQYGGHSEAQSADKPSWAKTNIVHSDVGLRNAK